MAKNPSSTMYDPLIPNRRVLNSFRPALLIGAMVFAALTSIAQSANLGDVTGDGQLDQLDAEQILWFNLGLDLLPNTDISCGDLNKDGMVNSLDALLLSSYLERVAIHPIDPVSDSCGLGLTVFPTQNVEGFQCLITSRVPLLGDIEVTMEGYHAVIDTIVPTRDSLVITIPDNVSSGINALAVAASELDVSDEMLYEIIPIGARRNLPASPPVYFFPNPGLGLPINFSISNQYISTFVNPYNLNHSLQLTVLDYDRDHWTYPYSSVGRYSSEKVVFDSVQFLSDILIDGFGIWNADTSVLSFDVCPPQDSVSIFEIKRLTASGYNIHVNRPTSKPHPYGEHAYLGFLTTIENFNFPSDFKSQYTLSKDIGCEDLIFPSYDYASDNFLVLTSQTDGSQLIFCEIKRWGTDAGCFGDLEVMPQQASLNSELLITSARPIGQNASASIECIETPINYISPTRDSLVITIPGNVPTAGSYQEIIITGEKFFGRTFVDILP